MEAGVRRNLDAAHHALMEVAELLSVKSGGAATHSGDLDVSTDFDARTKWHIDIHTSRDLIPLS